MCIRHPLDVLPSYGALMNTMSHGNKPEYDFSVAYPEWWAWFIKKRTKEMQKFFEIIIRHFYEEKRQPLYIVRYEDLVMAPKDTLMGLMSFLLEKKDLTGSNVERRIDEVVAQGSKAAQTYRLKSTTGQFNVHLSKYTDDQKQYIQDTLGDQLYYFGYANVEDNPTGFFDFGEHSAENLAKFDKFRADSKAALDKLTTEGYQAQNYTHNDGEAFPIFDTEDLTKMLEPAYAYAGDQLAEAEQRNKSAASEEESK